METVKIYGLIRDDVYNPYFMTSTSDEQASKFALDYYKKSIESVKDEKEKALMLDSIRQYKFMRLAYIDLVTHDVVKDECLLVDLSSFMKEVSTDGGEGTETKVSDNVSQ